MVCWWWRWWTSHTEYKLRWCAPDGGGGASGSPNTQSSFGEHTAFTIANTGSGGGGGGGTSNAFVGAGGGAAGICIVRIVVIYPHN